jgi:hypothetical protein
MGREEASFARLTNGYRRAKALAFDIRSVVRIGGRAYAFSFDRIDRLDPEAEGYPLAGLSDRADESAEFRKTKSPSYRA